jgi:GR25 family glycosyltransferase involved in LPS biosynthesis
MAKHNKWENVLILEDDAILAHLETAYPIFEELVKKPYDVIMLGGTMSVYDKQTYRVKKSQAGSSYLVHHSYYDTIVSQIEKVIAEFDPTVNTEPNIAVDKAAFKPLQEKDKWFIVKPSLFIQRKDYSNIEHRHVTYNHFFNK